ncbi:Hydroxypyruvate isomerase [Marinobacter algicola DG893]|uniref:Hydroxypyruvate isomerase n=1 Tax=Marinobacter algicola DG893 TaxID=443152 RepID=A6F558_9GAMM|nr:Hydroxypyruvate isomerase [Marinobacter algicola DG893]
MHEHGAGEINFRNVFAALDRLGYGGRVNAEYCLAGDTVSRLGWFGGML